MQLAKVALPAVVVATLIAAAVLPATAGGSEITPPGFGLFAFNNSTGIVEGAFVQFSAPESGHIIENYTSDGTLFFASVAVDSYTRSSEEARGSLYGVRGSGAEATMHDNPNAIMRLALEPNTTATFSLGGSISINTSNETALSLDVSGSNRTGSVWWTCGNSSLTVGGTSFDVTAPDARCFVFFRSHVETNPSDLRIAAAAGAMQLTAEVWVSETRAFDAASYGAASVVVTGTEDGIVVTVDPRGAGPQSIVIRYVDPEGPAKIKVRVDGRQAPSATDIEDALDATNDAGQAEYAVGSDGAGLLVVSLPDGEPHVIHIDGLSAGPADMAPTIVGLALGVAAVGLAGLALFRRRK